MMPSDKVFLSAEWKNLILLNYSVPDQVLQHYLPKDCELDRYNGSAYVSLVAFQFLHTRALGIRWPGYVNFPEINLRFYIQYKGRRGVCFIREFVPLRLVAFIARTLYNEPYKRARMTESVIRPNKEEIVANYGLEYRGGRLSMVTTGESVPSLPPEDSPEHFFKEHELGVGRDKKGNTVAYHVWHPHWRVYPVKAIETHLDWRQVYGPQFDFLSGRTPDSVYFAEGSEIRVFFRRFGCFLKVENGLSTA